MKRLLLAATVLATTAPALAQTPGFATPGGARGTAAITGGTISGADVSGANVTATEGVTALTIAKHFGLNISTTDYGATVGGANTAAINAAVSSVATAGGGVVRIPGNYVGTFTYTSPDPSVLEEFDGPNINRAMVGMPGPATDSGKVFSGVLGTTRPSGNNRAGVSDFFWSQGSGSNGATHGDFAHSFQLYKQNWNCSTARFNAGQCSTLALQGENDTLYLSSFQGGPDATPDPSLKSAGGLITGSANCIGGVGFCVQAELATNIMDPSTLTTTQSIDVQYGGINTRTGELSGYGVVYNSNVGTQTAAVGIQSAAGSAWTNVLTNAYQGALNFTIDDAGHVIFGSTSSPSNEVVLTSTGSLSGRSQTGGVQFQDGNGVVKAKINKDGTGGFSTGLVDTSTPAWATSTAYVLGQIAANAGNIYRVTNVGGTSSAAPTQTSGCVTGADSITWCFVSAAADATLLDFTGGAATASAPFYIKSAQQTPIPVPIMAAPGSPNGVASSVIGGIISRTDGSPGRGVYVNETGTTTGWNPVVTGSATSGITATGTTLAGAVVLTTRWNVVTSAPSGTGVALKGNAFPDEQVVMNRGANTLNVYPPSASAQIDSGGAGVAVTMAAGGRGGYYCPSATQCYTTR